MKPLPIQDRLIGPGRPTFVIAEIGVNHDGSVDRALELVDAAKAGGADAVKLQVFRATHLMHASSSFAAYQQDRCDEVNPIEMLSRYELPADGVQRIVHAIGAAGMIPLATPFSPDDVEVIRRLELPAIKIASPDVVNRVLLSRVARCGKPMLISVGAATMEEISQMQKWLNERGASFALLHCVSSYPTPNESANLCWIGELASAFDVPIGYSDHTTELLAGALAVAGGAVLVEKHLTYDRTAKGPDHAASADPQQFAAYVRAIRVAETCRGVPGKCVLDLEQDVRKVSRQSLVLTQDLGPGEVLRDSHLTTQRPGTGISPAQITDILGRKTTRALARGTMLEWSMLAGGLSADR